jgi:hypothetical protein
LVAVDGDSWYGTLPVLITEPGDENFVGEKPESARGGCGRGVRVPIRA